MKILRFYWDSSKGDHVNDQVITVTRETKTLLVGIDRRNPGYEYKFRKPDKPQTGSRVRLAGCHDPFSLYHYEICLE